MKKLLLITILFFSALSVSAQVSVSQDFVDDAAKAFALVVEQRTAIEDLKKAKEDLRKLVDSLEKSQRTPCVIAADKVKTDLTYWLDRFDKADEAGRKEIKKILKNTSKQGQKMLASQCGYTSESQFVGWLKVFVPFGIGLLF